MDLSKLLANAKKENLALAKLKEENPDVGKSVGQSEIEFKNPLPCPDFEKLLPEHFWNKDGTPLLDPKTEDEEGNLDVFRISQSLTGGLRTALIEGTCLRKLWFVSVERRGERKKQETEPMRLGTLYEFYLTGAYDYYGNKPEPKRKFIGSPKEDLCAADKRAKLNAEDAKLSLKEFGIDLHAKGTYSVDTKFTFKCYDGAADLRYYNHRLHDCKYTGILKKPDKYSKEAWNEENVKNSFSKQIQATLYSLLYYLKYGVIPTFEYIVFSNKPDEKAEFQIFKMNISEERFNMLKWMLLDVAKLFQDMINEDKFIEKPSFENCKGCPVTDCKVKQKYRKVIEVNI